MPEEQKLPTKKGADAKIVNQEIQAPETIKKNPLRKMLPVALVVLFVFVAGVAGYSSWELYKVKSPDYQKQMLEKQSKDIINTIGKLIELPSDTPQIATVTDVETLKKNQPFFDNSKNGDQILIFQKEVILYRPSINKIINVGPIINNTPQTAGQQEGPQAPSTNANQPAAISEPVKK